MPKSNIHVDDTQRTCKLSEGRNLCKEQVGRKNMKNSTKGGFSSRAIIPTINILPPPPLPQINSCLRESFILEAEKEANMKQKANNLPK